ncbi:MAG: Spy/CpxP family protein refolding chaperone [Stellaceae bacterium]
MIHLTKRSGGILAAAVTTAMILGAVSFAIPAYADMQLAQAGQAPPPGATPAPPNAPPPSMSKTAPADRIEARIKSLHEQLQITPAQESQWAAVAQAMRDSANQMQTLIQQRTQGVKTMTAVDDLHSYQAIAQAHLEGLNKLVPAFETLYASMSDAQKKNADGVFQHKVRATAKKGG